MAIKVLIIDDSALIRELLSEIINQEPDMSVVGTASDPMIGLEKIKKLNPDVLTLDIEMPKMNGLDFLRKLMKLRPMPVIMISSLTDRGAMETFQALRIGAVDYLSKPKVNIQEDFKRYRSSIADKIRGASVAKIKRLSSSSPEFLTRAGINNPSSIANSKLTENLSTTEGSRTAVSSRTTINPRAAVNSRTTANPKFDTSSTPRVNSSFQASNSPNAETLSVSGPLIFVGSSTGGTEALKTLLAGFPPSSPAILIAQHILQGFSDSLAKYLNQSTDLQVNVARDGEIVKKGVAYLAPAGCHLRVRKSQSQYLISISNDPPVNRHRPSVDVLFQSAAKIVGKRAIGIMLTGMGDDGASGMLEMKNNGAQNFAQDESSSVIFGMAKRAIEMGAVHRTLDLNKIAETVRLYISTGKANG